MRETYQRLMLPRLGGASRNAINLHGWIKNNRFSGVKLVEEGWILHAYSDDELYESFTPDFQRFAFSSYETFLLAGLEREKFQSMGWPLLKLYYAAFFAAHAVTRATGHGQVNLDKSVVKSVNAFLSIVGREEELAAGSYKVTVSEDAEGVFLTLRPVNSNSGVHDGFWRYFASYLADLGAEAVAQGLPGANDFLRETAAISSCVCDGINSGIWFSSIRNAINYRHEMECWKPNNRRSPPRVMKFPTQFLNTDSLEITLSERLDNLKRLANLSSYLCSLNYENITRVASLQNGNSSFAHSWRAVQTSMTG